MKRLLSIEWMKMKGYGAFIIISSLFALSMIAANYITFSFQRSMKVFDPLGLVGGSIFDYPNIWQTISWISGWTLVLPGFLLVLLVTNEFGFRTHRQNIIDGLSRMQFVNVKLMLGVIFAAVSTLLLLIIVLLFGLASDNSFSFHGIQFVFFFFLKALTYNVFAVFMGMLIRKTGLGISLYFFYIIIENGLSGLLLSYSIKWKREEGLDFGYLSDYLPLNASDGLLKFPEIVNNQMVKGSIESGMPTDFVYITLALAIGYVMLFWYLGRRRMVNSDL